MHAKHKSVLLHRNVTEILLQILFVKTAYYMKIKEKPLEKMQNSYGVAWEEWAHTVGESNKKTRGNLVGQTGKKH